MADAAPPADASPKDMSPEEVLDTVTDLNTMVETLTRERDAAREEAKTERETRVTSERLWASARMKRVSQQLPSASRLFEQTEVPAELREAVALDKLVTEDLDRGENMVSLLAHISERYSKLQSRVSEMEASSKWSAKLDKVSGIVRSVRGAPDIDSGTGVASLQAAATAAAPPLAEPPGALSAMRQAPDYEAIRARAANIVSHQGSWREAWKQMASSQGIRTPASGVDLSVA